MASSRSVNNMALVGEKTEKTGVLNFTCQEGLLSIYRGQAGDRPHFLEDFAHFRNDNSNEGGDQSGRRMSITNAMDILRDRYLTLTSHPATFNPQADEGHQEEARQPRQQGRRLVRAGTGQHRVEPPPSLRLSIILYTCTLYTVHCTLYCTLMSIVVVFRVFRAQ